MTREINARSKFKRMKRYVDHYQMEQVGKNEYAKLAGSVLMSAMEHA